MTRSMTITYEVDTGLYINVTNRCTNNCEFCIRHNGDGAYGSDSLWLSREPSEEEIMASVFARDLSKYTEVVFCGYGEPSERLEVCRRVALAIKDRCPDMKIRINTNGHSDLILGKNSAPIYENAFDTVSISLNTPSPEKYEAICHPVYGKTAFFALLSFAKNVKKYVHSVLLSVVRETLTDEELAECQKIAEALGVALKVRAYIGPEDN